mmetsp:Transcript_71964/g.192195  ORF Transcript_71964/g.192195 Transcript_71964/m.192195 type:complete len:117 (-) Transcript_71964:826-1176(-)
MGVSHSKLHYRRDANMGLTRGQFSLIHSRFVQFSLICSLICSRPSTVSRVKDCWGNFPLMYCKLARLVHTDLTCFWRCGCFSDFNYCNSRVKQGCPLALILFSVDIQAEVEVLTLD